MERWPFTLPLRLKSLFMRGQADRELDEELQFRIDQKIDEGIAQGCPPRKRAVKRCARSGNRAAQGRDAGHARRSRPHRLPRRRPLRGQEPQARIAADDVRRRHARDGDRHGLGRVQHARRVDLQALSRAPPAHRRHARQHVARQHVRPVLVSRVPGYPRQHEELRRCDRQRDAVGCVGFTAEARVCPSREGRDDGVRRLLPRAGGGAAARTRLSTGRRPSPGPRRRRRCSARTCGRTISRATPTSSARRFA